MLNYNPRTASSHRCSYFPGGREQCAGLKAIASSVERFLRYANCSGSSEAGSTEQMWSLMSFSKHLLKMGVRATGLQSFKHVILFFLGMGTMVDFLKHEGTTDRERDRLKMSVKTPASW